MDNTSKKTLMERFLDFLAGSALKENSTFLLGLDEPSDTQKAKALQSSLKYLEGIIAICSRNIGNTDQNFSRYYTAVRELTEEYISSKVLEHCSEHTLEVMTEIPSLPLFEAMLEAPCITPGVINGMVKTVSTISDLYLYEGHSNVNDFLQKLIRCSVTNGENALKIKENFPDYVGLNRALYEIIKREEE